MAGCQLGNYREDEECPGRVMIVEDGTEEWAVQRIISKKKEDGIWMYEIKWHGWPNKYNTWEPASHLTHCPEKLDEFEKDWKMKQRKSKARKSTSNGGEPVCVKTEQGVPPEAQIAGPSDVNVKEEMDTHDDDDEDNICGVKQISSDLDELWLGDCYDQFRREWNPTEEPLCVIGSAVVHGALLQLVRIRCPDDPEVIDDPEEVITKKNSVLVLNTLLREKFPHILIAYYEARIMMMDNLKSDENLFKDAARAGLAHNLLGAKVNAKYRKIFGDMMPPGQAETDSDDDNDEQIHKKPKNEEKKKVVVQGTKDEYGLPYYYGGEGEGIFGSDDEGSSDDSDSWEEVKGKGKSKKVTKKQIVGSKE